MIAEVEPLADAKIRRMSGKLFQGEFGRAVLMQQPHVKVPVIRRSFLLAVSSGGWPGTGEVIQTVPVDPLHTPTQELSRALQAECLDLLGTKRGGPDL